MSRQKQTFNRRLDQDTEPRLLDQGKYRAAKNARVGTSNRNNVGAVESAPSNALATYTFPSGTNKCIGTCQDVKNNAIIYCYFNSNGNHRILRLDANTNAITNILPTTWNVSVLGWTSGTRLWNMRIVETGDTQIMFFHAVQGVPMRINLGISALRPNPYTLTIDDITVARKPPLTAPSFLFADINNNINFVNDNNLQFRYRYIYENGEKSTLGPWSSLSVPDGNNYSHIAVTFNSGVKGVSKVELTVRIGNGVSGTGTENTTEYIWKVWEKELNLDNTNYTENFYFTETFTAISQNESNKLFDQVPQLVGCQEIVQSNQIIYGDVTEGYDNPVVSATLEATYKTSGIIQFSNSANTFDLARYTSIIPTKGVLHMITQHGSKFIHYYYELSQQDLASYPDNMGVLLVRILGYIGCNYTYNSTTNILSKSSGDTLSKLVLIPTTQIELLKSNRYSATASTVTTSKYSTPYTESGYKARLVFTLKMASSPATLAVNIFKNGVLYASQNISATISFQSFDIAFLVRAEIGDELNFSITGGSFLNAIQVQSLTEYFLGGVSNFNKSGFKLGSSADFGVVYYDQYLRSSGVVVKETVSFNYDLDNPSTWQFENNNPTKGFLGQAKITITSRPPSWAAYYQIVTSGSRILNFEQFVGNVQSVSDKTEITFDSLGSYDIAIGDIIRIVAVSAFDQTNGQNSQYCYNDPTISPVNPIQFDKPVMRFHSVESFDISTNKITTDIGFYDDANQFGAVLNNNRLIIEVMKPKPSSSEFFFEFGSLYEIGNQGAANRYHKANIQNQDAVDPIAIPAIIETTSGPVWYRFSNRINITLPASNHQIDKFFYILSYSSTDDRESNYWDQGRPQIETPSQRQQRIPWLYRWGNQLLQDTQVNGMSSFDSGNYGVLSARFGALTGMREIGYTLKMIQEQNYNSAFIGRRQIQNADGSTQLVVTDSLIGSVNPSEEMYGTKYPGSIIANGRRLYWLDTIKGCVVREAGNQPFRISDYGMVRYWRDACRQIEVLGYEVLTGWDWQTESLFITRKSDLIASGETINFYDPERESGEAGWVSEHDFKNAAGLFVDMYGFVGKTFTSTLASGVYIHNSVNSYLNLYGQAKTFSITSIFNPELDTEKVFLAHWMKANQSLAKSIFTVPVSAQNPNGMRTYLVPGNYAVREAQYFADLKNDGYTKGSFADDSAIFRQQMISGRPLREQVCFATIEYAGSTIFVLFSHDITYNNSPWS